MEQALAIFVVLQMFIFPFQLIAWWGMRQETERRERQLKIALRALGIISVVRGKR